MGVGAEGTPPWGPRALSTEHWSLVVVSAPVTATGPWTLAALSLCLLIWKVGSSIQRHMEQGVSEDSKGRCWANPARPLSPPHCGLPPALAQSCLRSHHVWGWQKWERL